MTRHQNWVHLIAWDCFVSRSKADPTLHVFYSIYRIYFHCLIRFFALCVRSIHLVLVYIWGRNTGFAHFGHFLRSTGSKLLPEMTPETVATGTSYKISNERFFIFFLERCCRIHWMSSCWQKGSRVQVWILISLCHSVCDWAITSLRIVERKDSPFGSCHQWRL